MGVGLEAACDDGAASHMTVCEKLGLASAGRVVGMLSALATDVLPELDAFAHAVRERRPTAGTWCEAWTVRDIVIHQVGNADELARVLAAHRAGKPVDTRIEPERGEQRRFEPGRRPIGR
jgi:hypothetical protein